ncbi:DUF4238 domain-containing protein [Sporosarcina limicola]|uniref:DUF4238 domain-containing protein n=1 Tax=Sporosarcina limicola TaxID=34101 RepID=A0A927R527_9BACL|nr:DUF4238 domain-containing protein [Sporosarcina limicola]MBE1556876.1 hypothetical protein [Sporosarcina limicola]
MDLDTDAVFHHLVPQTYMRGWKHGKSSVYFIAKNDENIDQDWTRNTKRLAGIDYFYSRRAGALYRTKKDCKKFFKPLSGYRVVLENQVLTHPLELNDHFSRYDKWDIYLLNGTKVSEEKKQSLKKEILNIHVRDIEAGWDYYYENFWNSIVEDILGQLIRNRYSSSIKAVRRSELIKFMVSLEWRTSPSHPVFMEIYEELLDIVNLSSLKTMKIPEENRLYSFLDTEYKEFIHNILLKYYYEFLNDRGPIIVEANKIINELTVELLIAPLDTEFITSDNPVCRLQNSANRTEYVFPINNKILCAIRKNSSLIPTEFYRVNYLNKNRVFYYNEALRKNCTEGYILKEKNLSLYFK